MLIKVNIGFKYMKETTTNIIVSAILISTSYLIALWTQSNIEFWFRHFGDPIDMPLWAAWLISLILNIGLLGINLVSEIVELFV
jgi:hypothetical protein